MSSSSGSRAAHPIGAGETPMLRRAPLWLSLAVSFSPLVSADYLITHMYPGSVCSGNQSSVSIDPPVECSVSVGGLTSTSATCVDSTLAVVTQWPTPNCTGAGNNNSVPLGVCNPEYPEVNAESVSCHRGPPPSTIPGIKATYISRVFNIGPAEVCPDPEKATPFAAQTIGYVTGICSADTATTDVTVECDPVSGNATFATFKHGEGCKGAPLSFTIYPACGPLGGDNAMTIVGRCINTTTTTAT
jgi:hypothetical protein